MASPPPSSSSPSGGANATNSGPKSPSPDVDEPRGRARTRQPPTAVKEVVAQPTIEGYHTFESMGRKFTIESRWKLVREMGIGAFGAVVSAQDTISGEHVAIKQINRVYDKPQLARRALREITLLRHFQTHPNITGLIDLDALSKHSNEIYIFMEPMEADLHQIIRSGQDLSQDHIAYFTYQILSAMKFVHGCKVMHRDLKPGNILVNATCEIRICDFGLARGYEKYVENDSNIVTPLTDYVATRWYRAPEIMLGFDGYDNSIDIWSIGCILGELLNGRPIFQGKDYVDQLKCIFEYLGSPDEDIVKRIARGRARKYIRSLPFYTPKPFKFPKGDSSAIDLMSQMIQYLPEQRVTAASALEHPWLAAFYDPEEEDYFSNQPVEFSRWKEIERLQSLDEFREAVWEEIQDYRTQARSLAAEHSMSPVVSIRQPMPSVREPIPEEEEEPDQRREEDQDQEDQPLFISHSRSRTLQNGHRSDSSQSRIGLSPARAGVNKSSPVRAEVNGHSPVQGILKDGDGERPTAFPSATSISPAASRDPLPYPTPLPTGTQHTPDSNSHSTQGSTAHSTQGSTIHNQSQDRPPMLDRPKSQHIHFPSESPVTTYPRPRKTSQAFDPYGTFSRRSSAIFGASVNILSHSPAQSSIGIHSSSNANSYAQFPVLDESEDNTPSVAVPVRSRLPSMVDAGGMASAVGSAIGGQFRHLRTLSTVSIHEKAERPGGLAAFGVIGKLVGAQKTEGADGPPSTPPEELRK